jgi:hypothetical protein
LAHPPRERGRAAFEFIVRSELALVAMVGSDHDFRNATVNGLTSQRYVLAQVFPYDGPFGWDWYLYRMETRN